jgi:hypothetical protein
MIKSKEDEIKNKFQFYELFKIKNNNKKSMDQIQRKKEVKGCF